MPIVQVKRSFSFVLERFQPLFSSILFYNEVSAHWVPVNSLFNAFSSNLPLPTLCFTFSFSPSPSPTAVRCPPTRFPLPLLPTPRALRGRLPISRPPDPPHVRPHGNRRLHSLPRVHLPPPTGVLDRRLGRVALRPEAGPLLCKERPPRRLARAAPRPPRRPRRGVLSGPG